MMRPNKQLCTLAFTALAFTLSAIQVVAQTDDALSRQSSADVQATESEEINSVTGYALAHSLWQHGTFDYHTGEWLARFANHAGKRSTWSGRFGQLETHAGIVPIKGWTESNAQLGYPSSKPVDVWTSGNWGRVKWDHVMTTPWNFAQNSTAYDTRPDPLSYALDVVDFWISDAPQAKKFIFEHWPETGAQAGTRPGPDLSQADWITYWEYTRGAYHTWFLNFQNQINTDRPTADIRMIPVGPVLADLFLEESYMSSVSSTDYFEDDAPHGLPALYFLSAMVFYRQMYGVNVESSYSIPTTTPVNIPPAIRDNFSSIINFIEARLTYYNENGVKVY